ncbi:hypothetical protein [Leifsonia sp. Leaf264]|uniref:hypothetical protein n=1 Tax=Leifsonia sp. Leaf264 TaxID=1736314 RepID=UPI0006F5E159|nr:hypothetical protein [Leifsonia sp. Leaf264]KQO98605.1 hypothetical protein ASF30_11120 [Leifsonia sp. Leaf264]
MAQRRNLTTIETGTKFAGLIKYARVVEGDVVHYSFRSLNAAKVLEEAQFRSRFQDEAIRAHNTIVDGPSDAARQRADVADLLAAYPTGNPKLDADILRARDALDKLDKTIAHTTLVTAMANGMTLEQWNNS